MGWGIKWKKIKWANKYDFLLYWLRLCATLILDFKVFQSILVSFPQRTQSFKLPLNVRGRKGKKQKACCSRWEQEVEDRISYLSGRRVRRLRHPVWSCWWMVSWHPRAHRQEREFKEQSRRQTPAGEQNTTCLCVAVCGSVCASSEPIKDSLW